MGTDFNHGYLDYPIFAFSQNYAHGHIEAWHSHERIQLIHTLSGVIRIQTEEGIWISPPGRGLWIPAGKPHALLIHGQVKARGVFIDTYSRADLANECLVVSISPLLRELMSAALQIQTEIQPHSRDERLLELILDEVRLLPSLAFNLPEPKTPALVQLCQQIRENLSETWPLEQAADQLHMSSKTLARYFQKETAMNFAQWIRQAKLMQAMTDLALHKSILTIALDLGYDSPSAFSAMFKRETAMTPSEYIAQFEVNSID
ncbi:AraC family transcriptional regulator [Acinetobacter pullicarnis]|jgi:AraC-like DNA-binding protein|uniref:AraC family transcriptional regulator n=1 Tax=Acinetobacter pullicarnis TaxID=2576829 RepID=UPI0011247E18|nr:helix-turn-helix transcriptional regulator [Acinetobacter pullicarnis]